MHVSVTDGDQLTVRYQLKPVAYVKAVGKLLFCYTCGRFWGGGEALGCCKLPGRQSRRFNDPTRCLFSKAESLGSLIVQLASTDCLSCFAMACTA